MICVDPGLDWIGVAVFSGSGELLQAQPIRGVESYRGPAAWQKIAKKFARWYETINVMQTNGHRLVWERPRVRRSGRGYSDDLFELVGVVGALSMTDSITKLDEEIVAYTPNVWTNGRPKTANHYRIWDRLGGEERTRFFDVSSSRLGTCIHDSDRDVEEFEHALDAVGLGLYELERLV